MTHRAQLRLRFASAEEAARLAESIAPENAGHLAVRLEGDALVADAAADTPLGLLHTLDDALACLSAGEKAGRVAGSGN